MLSPDIYGLCQVSYIHAQAGRMHYNAGGHLNQTAEGTELETFVL